MEKDTPFFENLDQQLKNYEDAIEEYFLNDSDAYFKTLSEKINCIEENIDKLLIDLQDSSAYKKYHLRYLNIKVVYLDCNNQTKKAKELQKIINGYDDDEESFFLVEKDSNRQKTTIDTYNDCEFPIPDNKAQNIGIELLNKPELLELFNKKAEFPMLEEYIKEFFSEQNHTIKDVDDFLALKQLYNTLHNILDNKLLTIIQEKELDLKEKDLRIRLENAKTSLVELIEQIEECMKKYYYIFINCVKADAKNIGKVLYKNILEKDQDEIQKRFKKLRLHFHPDTTHNRFGLAKEISEEFFILIEKCTQELKQNGFMGNDDLIEYENIANENYATAIELQNFLKNKNRTDFRYISPNDLKNHSDDDLLKMLRIYAVEAYEYYKTACKIADKLKLLDKKFQLRKNMSICLYLANKLLESQLLCISIYFLIENVSGFNDEQIKQAKQFIDDIQSKIKKKFVNPPSNDKVKQTAKFEKAQETDSATDMSKNQNDLQIISSVNALCLSNTALSPREKKYQQQQTREELNRALVVLINRQSLSLDNQKENLNELKKICIKNTKWRAFKAGVVGLGFGSVGLVSLSSEVALASKIVFTGAALGAVGSIIASGIVASYFIYIGYKNVQNIKEKYDCCSKLNDILTESIEYYQKEEYMKFLETLAKPYNEKDSTKKIINMIYDQEKKPLDFQISGEDIISKLLELDATPDCIASLLSIIATALLSGKIEIRQMLYSRLQAKAVDIFTSINRNEALEKRAKELDQKITKWVLENLKPKKMFDSIFGSKENKKIDNKSYRAKLNELKIAAKINLTILSITMDYGENGIEVAKSHMLEINSELTKCKYELREEISLRLALLEDFFWIITGEKLPIVMENSENDSKSFYESFDSYSTKSHAETYYDAKIKNTNKLEEMLKFIKKKAFYFLKNAEKKHKFDFDRFFQYKKALNELFNYYGLDKKNVDVICEILNCYLETNQYEKGIKFVEQEVIHSNIFENAFHENWKMWLLIAKLYRKANKLAEANHAIIESLKKLKSDEALKEEKIIHNLIGKSKETITCFYETDSKPVSSSTKGNSKRDSYKIVSIDGGGIRGILPSMILCEIERRARLPLFEMVDLFAGTSTGALIAAGLALPKSHSDNSSPRFLASDLLELYCEKSKEIFAYRNNGYSLISDYCRYDDTGRINIFQEVTADFKLSETRAHLLVTSANKDSYTLKQFTSYDALKSPIENISIYDAIMASSSAPTYFRPHSVNECLYLDGGVIANNPARLAYELAINKIKIDKKNVQILSLGTGDFLDFSSQNQNESKSLLFWAKEMSKLAIEGQTREVDRWMYENVSEGKYYRWQTFLESPIPLDDINSINKLIDIGNQFIEENDESINDIVKSFSIQ